MGSKYNLYKKSSSRKELDLRKELNRTLQGASDEIEKGRRGLLRKIRLDEDGDALRCPCRDSLSDEADEDTYCRYCEGVGWFWDEFPITYYKNDDVFRPVGNQPAAIQPKKVDAAHFYVEYGETINSIDIIVEVEVDKEGNIIQPVQRKGFYEIWRAEPFKSDGGRLEYWRVHGGLIRKWSVWYGIWNRKQIKAATPTTVQPVTVPRPNDYKYWGVSIKASDYSPGDISSLGDSELATNNGRAKSFTVLPEANEYIIYAYPTRWGEATFFVIGWEGGFQPPEIVSFTNPNGFTEDYYVYRSDHTNLGLTTIEVT